jgi:hypothetical protein
MPGIARPLLCAVHAQGAPQPDGVLPPVGSHSCPVCLADLEAVDEAEAQAGSPDVRHIASPETDYRMSPAAEAEYQRWLRSQENLGRVTPGSYAEQQAIELMDDASDEQKRQDAMPKRLRGKTRRRKYQPHPVRAHHFEGIA